MTSNLFIVSTGLNLVEVAKGIIPLFTAHLISASLALTSETLLKILLLII